MNVFMCPVSELSVRVPWGEIRGQVWGPDHGRPVLCLHGWADNCGTFKTLIPLLPKECRYVAVDLAGHGLSSHRPPGVFYSFPAYVADVRRVVDALQLEKFSIIGHSMGECSFTEEFILIYDMLFDFLTSSFLSLFLQTEISKVMRQGMEEMFQFENKKEKKTRVYSYEKAVERLLAANPTLSEESVHILLERGIVQVDGGTFFSLLLHSQRNNLSLPSAESVSLLQDLAEEGVNRKLSEPAPDKFTSTLLQCLQDEKHTVVKVPGGHHVHLNKPEVVAPFVSNFLRTKALAWSRSRVHKL
uniref:Serine hydrolase like n=1 Tax=Dicentrarchus labrax TaxID=13489 RepID=A0A8C4GNW2_DICLA